MDERNMTGNIFLSFVVLKDLSALAVRGITQGAGIALVGGSLACAASQTSSSGACKGVDVGLSPARQHEYAALIVTSLTSKVAASNIKIYNFMAYGTWSAAYAGTPISDDGVFFFQKVGGKEQFKDVWGGWADPSDKPDLIKWAETLGAPSSLASCFADLMTRH